MAEGKVKDNAWGVIATNTTLSRDAVQHLPHGDEAGGLSGLPVLEASNRVIHSLRQTLGPHFPLIGVGCHACRRRPEQIPSGRKLGSNLHRLDLPRSNAGNTSCKDLARAQLLTTVFPMLLPVVFVVLR
jgi:hypothetical protein